MRYKLLFQFLVVYLSIVVALYVWWLGVGLIYQMQGNSYRNFDEFGRRAILILVPILFAVLIVTWRLASAMASRSFGPYRVFSSFVEKRSGRIVLASILFYNLIYFSSFTALAREFDDELVILAYLGAPLVVLAAVYALLAIYRWIMEAKK